MARPGKLTIDATVQNWDAKLDSNSEVVFNGPLPIHEHVGDQTDIASTFPPASYDRCEVWVNHTVLGWSRYVSDGTNWIRVLQVGTIATIVALTDNTTGTANDVLQALTDPADTPATADALRDDLVANLIPEVRNNLADLAAKINELRTILDGHGLSK